METETARSVGRRAHRPERKRHRRHQHDPRLFALSRRGSGRPPRRPRPCLRGAARDRQADAETGFAALLPVAILGVEIAPTWDHAWLTTRRAARRRPLRRRMEAPRARHAARSAPRRRAKLPLPGLTKRRTGRCCFVGRRYWPRVRMSQPASRKSRNTATSSSSVSPRPAIRPLFTNRSLRMRLARPSSSSERSYRDPGRTVG